MPSPLDKSTPTRHAAAEHKSDGSRPPSRHHDPHASGGRPFSRQKHTRALLKHKPFFCEGFPEPEPGEWPMRWTYSKQDVVAEAERLLQDENNDEPELVLTAVQRQWKDVYSMLLSLVRARRMWRRMRRAVKRQVMLEWANVRSNHVGEEISRQTQKAAVDKGLELPGLKLREVPHELILLSQKVSGHVKRLSLHENRISYLPPVLFNRYTEVTMLRLSSNKITTIPSTIHNLTNLQMLLINDNDLCILPPALGDLVSLHTLHVQGNKRIRRLPREMGKLHHISMGGHLKDIQYDHDRVDYPPMETVEQGLNLACDLMHRVWDAAESGRLVISGMSLASLPPYVCDAPLVTCLTELNIFQNKITRLPPEMGLLTRLEALRLDESSIVFPNQHLMKQSEALRDPETRMIKNAACAPFMGFLKRIADCRLSRSMVLQGGSWKYGGAQVSLCLSIVSSEILGQRSCKLLDIRHNELKEIPEGISRLQHLTALQCDHNRIRHLPESLASLARLRAFTCSDNDLFDVPEVFGPMTSLVSLDLSNNSISHVPASVSICTALTRLNLSQNKIQELPETLSSLTCLRYLYVGYNPLEQLPPAVGASQWLQEVTADCHKNPKLMHFTPPEVLNGTVPTRCPLPDPQMGASHLLCNVHRLVGMLSEPRVVETCRKHLQLPTLVSDLAAFNGEIDPDLPEAVRELARVATQPHVPLTGEAALEVASRKAWVNIEYEPADTVYSRRWRLTKEATIRSVDPVILNQVVAAGLPQMGRSPPLVRYLWGLWVAQEVGIGDFAGTGMISIKEDVFRLSWITKLLLSYNRLVVLPEQITTLTQLVTIDLGHNQITNLPGYFGQLTTLVEINLCYNMLDSLPKEMAALANWSYPRNPQAMNLFTTDWARGNPLTFPHEQILQLGPNQTRGFLKQVTAAVETGVLDFQHRELPLFPDQLTDFAFLTSIDLSYNKIDRIPPAITNMIQLKSCVLSGNAVDRLPPRLSTLTSLEILDVRDNQLVGLPDSIGQLHAELKKLLLGRNRISSLPSTLGSLSNLVHLHLNWNQLTALPDEIGACTSLEELQLSYNKLRMIPQTFSNLTNLRFAALQNNLLELLPTCLGNMPNLHKLAFDNNMWLMPQQEVLAWSQEHNINGKLKLSTGMRVWCRFQRLQSWRPAHVDLIHEDGTFDLSYKFDKEAQSGLDREFNVPRTEIVELEEESKELEVIKPLSDHERLVDFLTRLHSCGKNKDLDFSGFHMTEYLDYEAGSGFKHINEAGWYTRGLRKLNLSHNWLSTLPLSVSRLSTLTVLDLKHNFIIGLPETLSALVCLKDVDLSHNRLTVLPCGLGLAAELETIATHHNPLIAPPTEIVRQGAQKIAQYLRAVHMARKNGKLDWNKLNLCTIDTLTVMMPEGDTALIQELYLDDNMIVVLNPSVLCELQNLEVFRCCRNYLTFLHPNLASFCPKLEQVTVDGNRLTHMPATLGTLTALLSISCDDNPHLMSPPPEINSMPSSAKIRYLQELHKCGSEVHDCAGDFSDFDLNEFPEALVDLWTLKKLSIAHNNLTRLHPGVCKWGTITALNLEHNELSVLEVTLGLCCKLTELNVSNNCLRRIPSEYGNLSLLSHLTMLPQKCAPALDINGRSQGYAWCAKELTLRHVHNISDCKIYPAEPVEDSLCCPVCLEAGDLELSLFPSAKCYQLLEDYHNAEATRAEMGKPPKPQPTRTCPNCGIASEIRNLVAPPALACHNVRVWLPSRLVNMNTWSPPLPLSTFNASYTRRVPARSAADLRPQADLIESPPSMLLELDEGVGAVVTYLKRCLLGRTTGVIDVCGFELPQFPLEALDLAALRELKASNNSIKDLPDDLDRLTNLQVLHLDHNLLETLPAGVRFLTALQDLQLNDNLLHDICPELGACVNLQKLNLHENRLVTLPHTMGNCSLLTQLTIQKNKMIVLPPALSQCQKNMKHLDLDRDAATNTYRSPPNPIPQQSSFQVLRYLEELYTYSKECRLLTPGYHLDYIPDLMLEAATSVTALSLDENNISMLPEEIGSFTLLTELFSVCDNRLSAIPACVGNMTKLTCLRLSGNSLVELPDELSSMVMLKTLLVDHNNLSEVNRCFSTMTCLEVLSFVDNKVREAYPEFGLISSIHTLRMHDNPMVLPGPEVIDRPTPQVVDYLGRIKISQFTGYLDLGDMDLNSLMYQLHDAYEARAINLARNHLTTLPQDFSKFQHCEELILDNNPMPYLEDVIGKLKNLQLLSVEKMREPLRAFPENTFGGLRALVVLRAANNSITSLPDVFKFLEHMEFLDMTANLLKSLPESLVACKRIKVLLLSHNRLEKLFVQAQRREGFSNFVQLHTVDVSNNFLSLLSRGMGWLATMPNHKLKNHDLSNNAWVMPPLEIQKQGERKMLKYVGDLWRAKLANGIKMIKYHLTEIHDEIIQENLVELTLDDNLITEIPAAIGKLKKLEEFSIVKNRITALPEQLFELKFLSVLKVDDNKITEIPRAIIKLSRCLTWLSIERNPIRFFPGELANMESLEIINASPLGLDADVKHAFNSGFETFIAYMKAWSTVGSTGRLALNWNANSAWDPLLEMPVQCWRFAGTLTQIYLNDNNIRVLPQNIAIMHALKELHLERNGLSCLPYVMCQMTNLQVLSLTDNTDMHDPPYEIVVDMKLPGIMRYLRAFHMAPLLKSLILQDFDLYYLKPNDVVSTTVEELSVLRKRAEFKRTDGQPRNLGEVQRINRRLALFNIEALSLDSNQFNDLPEHVFVLTRLSMLSLAHNQLEILGKKVEVWSSLTVLHLNNNRLGSIPDELASSCRMKKLTLDHNEFIFFPDVILQLTALEVLNLASNQIEELPAEMPSSNSNLKMLALQHNGLHSLPADIGMLQKLVLCDLSHNHLIALPQSISQCRRLKALYLTSNPLPAFPKAILVIRALQQLRLSDTLMTGLPPEMAVLTNLKELAIENNALVWPPPEVLSGGLEQTMDYIKEHYELLDLEVEDILEYQKEKERAERIEAGEVIEEDEEEEEWDPFEGMEVGRQITVDSILEHGVRVEDFIAEMEECQQELEQLEKEHVKHSRIGNKGKIAELDRRIDFINKQRRSIAGRIVEINNLRLMEEELLMVDSELALMENPCEEAEEGDEDDEERQEAEGIDPPHRS